MSRVLLAGMSAPQASQKANSRSLSFAGLIYKALVDAGHDVVWSDPTVMADAESLSKFDAVLVGMSPLTSLGANRAYSALNIIGKLWGSNKLTLFIDAPQVNQIEFSIKAVHTNKDNLIKPFFSYRKDYDTVVSNPSLLSELLDTVEKLHIGTWPTTIYPALPWSDTETIRGLLPSGVENLVPINLDAYVISDSQPEVHKRTKWSVDNYKDSWTMSTIKTLAFPHVPMKWNKGWSDEQVAEQLERSVGALIAPYKREKSWWTYRYVQALNSATPVATDWRGSSKIGPAWDVLAAGIESLSDEDRHVLAQDQKKSYIANIPSKEAAIALLEGTMNISKNQEN